MVSEHDREWQEEADRLKALPRAVQREVIALHRATAEDPKATRSDREYARRRAAALEKLLGLSRKR